MSLTKNAVLVLNFNRPHHTARALESLTEVAPKRIFLAQDGPRKGVDEQKCEQVTEILKNRVNWDCEKNYLIRETNLGCKKAVSEAIDWFFSHVDRGIILEDDCILYRDFFPFVDQLLTEYEADQKVAMITGFNPGVEPKTGSYFFSRWALTIGWATWKAEWQQMDLKMTNFPNFEKELLINDLTPDPLANKYMLNKWRETYENRIDSWAYRWGFHQYTSGKKCIVPASNMLRNYGVNELEATHTTVDSRGLDKLKFGSVKWPLTATSDSKEDALDIQLFYKLHKSRMSLVLNKILPNTVLELLRPVYIRFLKWTNR